MKTYTEKDYREARMVSVKAHGTQDYDGVFPYKKHLDDVVAVLERFGFSGKFIIAGYLHDIIEDTEFSYNKVNIYFGYEIAEMVYCVTDELGRNRVETKKKTLEKTASNSDAIIIKLADRIANIEHGGKIGMYAKEYNEFQSYLRGVSHDSTIDMWKHLDELLMKELT